MTNTEKFAIAAIGLWFVARWRAQRLTPAASMQTRSIRAMQHPNDADRIFAPIGGYVVPQSASFYQSTTSDGSGGSSSSSGFSQPLTQSSTSTPAEQSMNFPIDFPAPPGGWHIEPPLDPPVILAPPPPAPIYEPPPPIVPDYPQWPDDSYTPPPPPAPPPDPPVYYPPADDTGSPVYTGPDIPDWQP